MFGDPFSMVVAIVLIVAVAGVARARLERQGGGPGAAEVEALRTEVRALRDRVAVLERLATDDGAALDREIERLRRER